MRTLSSADFLGLWEHGSRLHPLDQGLLALSTVLIDTPYDRLADWPLGRRNRALAEMRCSSFGPLLEGWIACPQCAEKLEFQMDTRVMMKPDAAEDRREPIVVNGRSFRLPTSRDLARAAVETDPRLAAILLLESCRVDDGPPLVWTDDDLEQADDQMALADPLSETRVTLQCPKCGHQWNETLELATFLWAEIEARAKRLLLETHTLASAYGWTESEILSLSDRRRATYLEMVRA